MTRACVIGIALTMASAAWARPPGTGIAVRYPVEGLSSPLEVSGCVLWLDGADASSMYNATSGGSLVANGGAIYRWQDKSGGNYHATNGVAANCPLRVDGALNGHGVVRFSDTSDGLYFPRPTAATATTVFYVYSQGDRAAGVVLSDNSSWLLMWTSGSGLGTSSGVGSPTYYRDGVAQTWTTRNDVYLGVKSRSAVVEASAANLSGWGAQWRISRFLNTTTWALVGDLGEVIIYSRTLTAGERQSVEAYLRTKWGTS